MKKTKHFIKNCLNKYMNIDKKAILDTYNCINNQNELIDNLYKLIEVIKGKNNKYVILNVHVNYESLYEDVIFISSSEIVPEIIIEYLNIEKLYTEKIKIDLYENEDLFYIFRKYLYKFKKEKTFKYLYKKYLIDILLYKIYYIKEYVIKDELDRLNNRKKLFKDYIDYVNDYNKLGDK